MKLPITYSWKCSKCGRINTVSTQLKTSGSSSARGTSKKHQHARNLAEGQANYLMSTSLIYLSGVPGKYSDYRSMGLNHSCKECGYKEVWAVPNLSWINYLVLRIALPAIFLLGFILIIAFFSCLKTGDWSDFFPYVGIEALLVFFLWIASKMDDNYNQKKDNILNNLPIASFPVLVIDGVPVANTDSLLYNSSIIAPSQPKDVKTGLSGDTASSPQIITTQTLCPNCGATNHEADALFCWRCGHRFP